MSARQLALLGGTPVRTEPFPAWPMHDKREEELLLDTLRSGKWWRYAGDKVRQFEEAFAKRHDARYGLAVTNGTSALEAALRAVNLDPDAEVLVPSYTFASSATSVINSGAKPCFVDVSLETLNIDLEHAESCITSRTQAIMPVHFAGLPCNMDEVKAFAERHNLYIVEDAAQAHGARWKGQGVGSLGHVGAFSFQMSKNMTAGEGGIVLTDDERFLHRAFSRHTFGPRPGQDWYTPEVVSSNYRMTEWQGAILLAQLERMDELNERRAKNARILNEAIDAIPYLKTVGASGPEAAERVYHLFTWRYSPGLEGIPRSVFIEALKAEGIPCEPGYPMPLQKQPVFRYIEPPLGQPPYEEQELPNVARLCEELIWFRQYLLLGTEEDTRDIVRAIEKVVENADALRTAAAAQMS